MREKVGKSRNTVFFQWFCGSGGKSRLAKAAGAEPSGQMRDEKVHVVVARSTFWSVVARSTFRSQNVQNTPGSDHFWKLRCRKSARWSTFRSQNVQNRSKHTILGPLLEVEMSKKCTLLWREAHFEVKILEVQMSFRVAGARDCAPSQKLAKREVFVAFPQTMAGVGHLKRICKMHFPWQAHYKRHVHQSC